MVWELAHDLEALVFPFFPVLTGILYQCNSVVASLAAEVTTRQKRVLLAIAEFWLSIDKSTDFSDYFLQHFKEHTSDNKFSVNQYIIKKCAYCIETTKIMDAFMFKCDQLR